MVNSKIASLFNLEVRSDNTGRITIPASIFAKNKNAHEEILDLVREEAVNVGQPFYVFTASTSSGVLVSWSKIFKDTIPDLESEEDLVGSGLVCTIRKVG